MFVLVNISGLHYTFGQVNHEIFSEEDLLATDSDSSVNQFVLPPPSNFVQGRYLIAKRLSRT